MNEEALMDSFELFKSTGYNGTIEDYKNLINENEEALADSFNLFTSTGYKGNIDNFSTLIGVGKPLSPVKEVAAAGLTNQATDTESNLGNGSLGLQDDGIKTKKVVIVKGKEYDYNDVAKNYGDVETYVKKWRGQAKIINKAITQELPTIELTNQATDTESSLGDGFWESLEEKIKANSNKKFIPLNIKDIQLQTTRFIPGQEIEIERPQLKKPEDVKQKVKQRNVELQKPLISNFRSSAKSILREDGIYRLGVEGQKIDDLIKNGVRDELIIQTKELYKNAYALEDLPNDYAIEHIIDEEIAKVRKEENDFFSEQKNKKIQSAKEEGLYRPAIEKGVDDFIRDLNQNEQELANLIQEAKKYRRILLKTENSDEIQNAENNLMNLKPLISNAFEKMQQDKYGKNYKQYSYLFDPLTGDKLGGAEAIESDNVADYTEEIEKLTRDYKNLDEELLEREFFRHNLDSQDISKRLNYTIDLKPTEGTFALALGQMGYANENGVFKNVKFKDIMNFRNTEYLQKSIYNPEKGIVPILKTELNNIAKDRLELGLEREALKNSYILNIDPASIKLNAADYVERFGETVLEASLGEDIASAIGTTKRKELDELENLFNKANIQITEAQKKNFERGVGMKVTEGVGYFVPELAKFALANKVAGAAGITRYIAQLANSGSRSNKIAAFVFEALLEEAKFEAVTAGEAKTLGGAGFFVGGKLAGKFIPKFSGKMAAFNNVIEKYAGGAVGGVVGSESSKIAEAAFEDLIGNKDFKASMNELYGDIDETTEQWLVDGVVFGLLGVQRAKIKDFTTINRRRKLLEDLDSRINSGEFKGKELEKKIALAEDLQRDINIADREFNNQNIGAQKAQADKAKQILQNPEASSVDKKNAQKYINKYEANIAAAKRQINRQISRFKEAGVIGKDINVIITEGKEYALDGAGENRAIYDPFTNTVKVDILQHKPGIFAEEIGHAFAYAALKQSPQAAQILKNKIETDVNNALKGKTFSVNNKEGLTFEQAIKEAYPEKARPEEYVMNVVNFLSEPSKRDILLETGVIKDLQRGALNIANRVGLDYTAKKNFTTGAQVLEFLFSIGKVAEGGSTKAIKDKFRQFENMVIDGRKLKDFATGKEILSEEGQIKEMQSVNIEESTKKDVFSKAEKMYEEYKDNMSNAGLMVGMEFEPIVRKMTNKYRDLYGMDKDTMDDLITDVMIETRPGYNGIPDLVKSWSKGQELITFIKRNNPSEEVIKSKAKELGIGKEESINSLKEMAEGKKAQASLTSYIYGNLPKRILGIIQRKYADLGRTVGLETEKAEKLTTEEGLGGGGGFVDISSPEAYTRVSQKKAEAIMGMPESYSEKAAEVGKKILMSIKLQDLDATSVGIIESSEGETLRVAMLESNKARITKPDGTVEIIQARSPKVVEQRYGAPEKSFKKIPTTKDQMISDAKDFLIPEIEKEAGYLKDNYTPTPKYEAFIDKTFPLLKDYISQSAINKRFADFKEPVIDPATGKQKREKTAVGKGIFTKKNITLAEWRKYFIGDGTMRIDGRRRSLLEALATEQGFDKVMETLSKESLREQVESRQTDLSVDLAENYISIIAKSLDRNNPTIMANKIIEDVAKFTGKTEEYIKNELMLLLNESKDNYFNFINLLKEKEYKDHNNLFTEFHNALNEDYNSRIKDAKANRGELAKGIKTHMLNVLDRGYDVSKFMDLQKFSKTRYDNYKNYVNEISSYLIPQIRLMNFGRSKSAKTPGTLLSRFFGFDGFRSQVLKDKNNNSLIFSREEFLKDLGENGEKIGSKYIKYRASLSKEDRLRLDNLNNDLNLKDYPSLSIFLNEFRDGYTEIATKKGTTQKDLEEYISKRNPKYIKEQELRTKFFYNILDVLDYVAKEQLKKSESAFKNYIEDFIAPFFIEQSKEGFRNFSVKEWWSTVPGKRSKKVTDQHIKAKVVAAAEFIDLFSKIKDNPEGALNKEEVDKIMNKFESSFAAKEHQSRADKAIGSQYSEDWAVKIGAEELLQKGQNYSLDFLKTTKSVITGETLYDRFLKESFNPIIEGLKQDAGAKANNDQIINNSKQTIMASKDIKLDAEIAKMIERKKGLPADKPISQAVATNIGKGKGKFAFYLPPNSEDFNGLMYKIYGKGKQGDADMSFIKEKILDPYNRGEQAISTYKQNLAEDYKSMEKQLGELGGKISKETKQELENLNFNADQAVRVALWNQAGYEIPGISNLEAAKLRRVVLKDKRLKSYADGIKAIIKSEMFEPSETWYSSNIKYDLFKHATEGSRAKFLEEWQLNSDAMFTKENFARMEAAYGSEYVKNLKEILQRMKTGKNRPENLNTTANKALDYINGSVGVIMWMNTRSAILQTISAVNYVNWHDNNPLKIAQSLSNPKNFAKNFMEIWNSDFLKQRRSGLEINIEEAEIARAVEQSKNSAQKLFNLLIKKGFKPTQIADSFAIAIGGTPLLINRTKTYIKQGFTEAEAKKKAFEDLREISEENQQSSRMDKVSNIQTGILGRLVFAFNNTPFQMTRLQKKAALDLINRRGDWKTNISKLTYYSAIQSIIFYALQQGTLLALFGKDDEKLSEKEKENLEKFQNKKTAEAANAVIDGFLSGSGMPGKILVTGKNVLKSYYDESKKGYTADYGNTLGQALSVSPPLSSKYQKVYSAFKSFKYGSTKKGIKELEEYNKFSPLHPYNVARAKIFAATTNVPIDRLLKKTENLYTAYDREDVDPSVRIALSLGWGKSELGFYDDIYSEPNKSEENKSEPKKSRSEIMKESWKKRKENDKKERDSIINSLIKKEKEKALNKN